MNAYAIGQINAIKMGPDIVEYLEQIDATLAPFGGRFLIHGGALELLEGSFDGDLVLIAFPDMPRARQWYASPGYRAILPLRLRNASSNVFLAPGVDADHKATDVLQLVPHEAAARIAGVSRDGAN